MHVHIFTTVRVQVLVKEQKSAWYTLTNHNTPRGPELLKDFRSTMYPKILLNALLSTTMASLFLYIIHCSFTITTSYVFETTFNTNHNPQQNEET